MTLKDCQEVLKDYINSVTPEMLLRFEAYDKGLSYDDLETGDNMFRHDKWLQLMQKLQDK